MKRGPTISLRNAPALRFMGLFVLAWVAFRALTPDIWAQRADPPYRQSAAVQYALEGADIWPPRRSAIAPTAARTAANSQIFSARTLPMGLADGSGAVQVRQPRGTETKPFLPLLGEPLYFELSPEVAAVAAEPSSVAVARGDRQAVTIPPPTSARQMAGWSLSAWALVRQRGEVASAAALAGELAGSQAGARLAYGFGPTGRLRGYGRATMALQRTQQSEVAAGLTYAPIAALPIEIAVERREKLGSEGRSAMAAMLVGGVSGKPLPLQFRLDGYGQAGIVGLRSRDVFADGAIVIDRSLNVNREAGALRVGAVIAGAVQPHLSRLDVGPRVTLPLPKLGKGARIAVDWRERVAGQARPDGGLAVTLGADF